jgi:uncharacterized protein (DUF305 family)
MTSTETSRLAALLLAAVALPACGSVARQPAQTAPSAQPAATVRTDAAAIAKARADSARLPYTDADVHFMSGMISHHAQAIVMANWAATHDAGPTIRILAGRIITAQQDEIVIMQQWLADRQKPVPEANPAGMKMTMHGAEHVMLMPGMLSEAQMKELDEARGADFDRLFLRYMIQHHRGAVVMVKELFASQGAATDDIVFKFASDVHVDQSTEIARMEKMLGELTSNQRNQ